MILFNPNSNIGSKRLHPSSLLADLSTPGYSTGDPLPRNTYNPSAPAPYTTTDIHAASLIDNMTALTILPRQDATTTTTAPPDTSALVITAQLRHDNVIPLTVITIPGG